MSGTDPTTVTPQTSTAVPADTQAQLMQYWRQFGPTRGEIQPGTMWDDGSTTWDDGATIWPE
jgi:hypothetical protein